MIRDYQAQKTLREDYDVCIIGAGPAGITLALRLAQAGWKVVLAEVNGLQNIWLWNVSAKEKRPAIWRRRQVPGRCSGVFRMMPYFLLGSFAFAWL